MSLLQQEGPTSKIYLTSQTTETTQPGEMLKAMQYRHVQVLQRLQLSLRRSIYGG